MDVPEFGGRRGGAIRTYSSATVIALTVVAVIGGIVLPSPWSTIVLEAAAFGIVVWSVRGLRRVASDARRPWTYMVAATALWVAGDVIWDAIALRTGAIPTVSVADILYLAAYPVLAIGCHKLLALRAPNGDREGVIDGLAMAVASAMAAWQFLVIPGRDSSLSLLEQGVAAAYPVADVLLVAAVAWLLFSPGQRSRSLLLLAAYALAVFANDVAYAIASIREAEQTIDVLNCLYVLCYLPLGLALRHPDISKATEPVHQLVRRTNPVRLALLGLTMYAAPLIAFVRVDAVGESLWVMLGGTTALSTLVLIRFTMALRGRERMQEAAAFRAFHDELTGLPNRALLIERIAFARARQHRSQAPLAVLFLDLDRFKTVNDTWGHATGDLVLKEVAECLRQSVRDGDVVARVGGDEFAVLCEDITYPDVPAEIAERIVATISTKLRDEARLVSVSVGIAMSAPADDSTEDTADDLLHRADVAMYRVKGQGGRAWRSFDDELASWSEQRRSIESALAGALDRGEFEVEYQPIVALGTGAVVGVEALLRWQTADGSRVSPVDFIPVAETSGMIIPIGEWVLHTACAFAAVTPGIYVSVNLSGVQLKRADVITTVRNACADAGIEPSRLVLELTESVLLTDVDRVRDVLDGLSGLGCALAVDDFGTGYSSLAYLDSFPINYLKIDRHLLDRIDVDNSQFEVVRAIASLSRSLGHVIVPEGIERTEQRVRLEQLGAQFGQGFLFARSLNAVDVTTFISARGTSGSGSVTASAGTTTLLPG